MAEKKATTKATAKKATAKKPTTKKLSVTLDAETYALLERSEERRVGKECTHCV